MKPLSAIGPDLRKYIRKLESPKNMRRIANEGARLIAKRTRAGMKGSNDGSLDDLAESTKRMKKRRGKHLGDLTPTKSRLTDTGKMLNSMRGKGRQGRGLIYFIAGMDKRAGMVEEAGRVFFDISKKDSSKLWKYIRKIFRKVSNTEV